MNTPIIRAVDAVWADAITHAPWRDTGYELMLLLDRGSFMLLSREAAAQAFSVAADGSMRYRGMPVFVVSAADMRYPNCEDFTGTTCEIVLRKA